MSTERGTSHIFAINRPKISPIASVTNENKKEMELKSVINPVSASSQTHCDDSIVGDTSNIVNDQIGLQTIRQTAMIQCIPVVLTIVVLTMS